MANFEHLMWLTQNLELLTLDTDVAHFTSVANFILDIGDKTH